MNYVPLEVFGIFSKDEVIELAIAAIKIVSETLKARGIETYSYYTVTAIDLTYADSDYIKRTGTGGATLSFGRGEVFIYYDCEELRVEVTNSFAAGSDDPVWNQAQNWSIFAFIDKYSLSNSVLLGIREYITRNLPNYVAHKSVTFSRRICGRQILEKVSQMIDLTTTIALHQA